MKSANCWSPSGNAEVFERLDFDPLAEMVRITKDETVSPKLRFRASAGLARVCHATGPLDDNPTINPIESSEDTVANPEHVKLVRPEGLQLAVGTCAFYSSGPQRRGPQQGGTQPAPPQEGVPALLVADMRTGKEKRWETT